MRVDLILTNRKGYTYEAEACREVCRSFNSIGIDSKTVYLEDGALEEDYLFQAYSCPPQWILSFHPLTTSQMPLCDLLRVPHFYWPEKPCASIILFLKSSYANVGIADPTFYQKFGADNLLLLAHGITSERECQNKVFEVVLFADLVECAFLEKTWEALFSQNEIEAIKKGIELGGSQQLTPYFFYIDQFVQAQQTYRIISAFKTLTLDVFGSHVGNNWVKRLPEGVRLHTPLPYTEHVEVLQMSKIALLKPDSHWYGVAVAAGCLPLSGSEGEIAYYLAHPEEREKRLEKLREKFLEQTWAKQTRRLIGYMK
jgi:hypothetical protein